MAKTLGSTINQLLDELDRTGRYTAKASTYINLAIDHYKKDPFPFNEEIATSNTQTGEEFLDLPANWGEEYTISIDSEDGRYFPMNYRTNEEMEELYISSNDYVGQPLDYTIIREQIRLGPIPDSNGYSVKMVYRKLPETATASTQTNFFITRANDLILNRAGAKLAKKILRDFELSKIFQSDEAEALQKLKSLTTRYQLRGRAKKRR